MNNEWIEAMKELKHLHEVMLGFAELKYLDEITEENAEEYSDVKLYEKWESRYKEILLRLTEDE